MTAPVYLDASAVAKRILEEPGWQALDRYLEGRPVRVASAIAAVEVRRAVARASGSPQLLDRAEQVLRRLDLVDVTRRMLDVASRLEPPVLRTLDAIHLATALELAPLDSLVTYDARLAEAARSNGIAVVAPGAEAATPWIPVSEVDPPRA